MALKVETGMSLKGVGGSPRQDATQSPIVTKMNEIRDKALQLIRNFMPVAALFAPEFKIDLSLFIKDQVLFYRIAEFLAPLAEAESIDSLQVENHFKETELLLEIKTVLQGRENLLGPFYQACADVLNQAPFSSQLKSALEGRVYTLKNGLIAQQNPEEIRKSQIQRKTLVQDVAIIQEEGATFIRECLHIHLSAVKGRTLYRSFREDLTVTAGQLVPFVKKITHSYLLENEKNSPENPLTFRNPTGHNYHGLAAAMVMEACLNALGYSTKLMNTILDPRVTLATVHNIVVVVGPDKVQYVVDPSYLQFHKDICLDEAELPTSPVLVLEEGEIEGYIEKQVMSGWRRTFALVRAEDTPTIIKLQNEDRLFSFMTESLKKMSYPAEFIPDNPEEWVRRSFQRVWGLVSHHRILANIGFQEIFYGTGSKHGTYDLIQSMNIASLTYHRPNSEVVARLNQLLQNPAYLGQNSPEALALIGQLYRIDREKYLPLLDCDPRLQAHADIDIALNAYLRALRKRVNPTGKDLTVIYGCSGADCTSIFNATDASDFIYVDLTPTSITEFQKAVKLLKPRNPAFEELVFQKFIKDNFLSYRSRFLGATSHSENGMSDLALKFIFDLREIGVDLNQVVLSSLPEGVQFEFPWQYYGASSARMRRVTFVTADITKPTLYPALLQEKIKAGFDIFYLKGAFTAPSKYPQFLPYLARWMKPEGWLMTTDLSIMQDCFNPEPCLKESGFTFTLHEDEEIHRFQEMVWHPINPLDSIPVLDDNPDKRRISRLPTSTITYWSILNLRQKRV